MDKEMTYIWTLADILHLFILLKEQSTTSKYFYKFILAVRIAI